MGSVQQSPRCAAVWMRHGGSLVIKHIVMLRLVSDYDAQELAAVMSGLAGLVIKGFESFEHGPNRDIENKSSDYPYGFLCSFADLESLKRYANDQDHRALGQRLVALCAGGANGIMVMDLDV